MSKYIFIKVTDKQVVDCGDVDTAIQTALAQDMIKVSEINDYVVLKQNSDGEFYAGTIKLSVDWS